ncbi:MAG: TolC family protein [Flavobacteriales bacterium]|nr:TolC family protein [Flavobacteriales bacterium]
MKILSTLGFFFAFSSLQAQQIWSLKDCIDHALKNNISLKQSELNIQLNESQHLQSKMQLLPSINASNSFNKNQGRYVNPLTNDFVEDISSSLNLSYSTNITLFNGFKNINQIKKAANESLKSIYDLESTKNDLISSIALSYLQILFNKELYQTAAKQLDLTKNLENRMITLVDAGSIARGELLNIQSQLALEQQQLIQAENQLHLSKLQLAQLLELENHQNLEVLKLNLQVPDFKIKDNINADYKIALNDQSSIKSAELQIHSALYDLKIAKANYLPNLSLGHSTSTLYADNAEDMFSFNEQLKNNKQSGIYLNLSIPIFNKWATHVAVDQSKIQIENSRLSAQQAKNQLRKNMEQAYADQLAAYKKYQAAQKSVIAYRESFTYINERYELGMVNSYEFNESKNKLIKSESDELQAKYDLIFKVKLYEFYISQTFEL